MKHWNQISLRDCFRFHVVHRMLLLLTCLGCTFVPLARAQSGSISASLNPCTIAGGGTLCTSAISWSSSGTSAVQVWVSNNGGTQALFAATGSGGPYSQNAPWIGVAPANSYVFSLYDYSTGSRGSLLGSVTVTGVYSLTLTMTNTTRPSIGSNFVVGDYFQITAGGGPPSALVQIQWTSTTGGNSTYNAGNTDGSGNFSSTPAIVLSASIGRYTGQGLVGGVAAGASFGTEIIAVATSLDILSTPTGVNCLPGSAQPYGFGIQNLNWQVKTFTFGVYEIPMTAHVSLSVAGGAFEDASVALGFLPNFDDPWEPLGYCSTAPISGDTFSEVYDIQIGGIDSSPVRTNGWIQTSLSPHAGETKNNDDVDVVYP